MRSLQLEISENLSGRTVQSLLLREMQLSKTLLGRLKRQ